MRWGAEVPCRRNNGVRSLLAMTGAPLRYVLALPSNPTAAAPNTMFGSHAATV